MKEYFVIYVATYLLPQVEQYLLIFVNCKFGLMFLHGCHHVVNGKTMPIGYDLLNALSACMHTFSSVRLPNLHKQQFHNKSILTHILALYMDVEMLYVTYVTTNVLLQVN
jgi:hypothetical protein